MRGSDVMIEWLTARRATSKAVLKRKARRLTDQCRFWSLQADSRLCMNLPCRSRGNAMVRTALDIAIHGTVHSKPWTLGGGLDVVAVRDEAAPAPQAHRTAPYRPRDVV